jgi:hypothetical protein
MPLIAAFDPSRSLAVVAQIEFRRRLRPDYVETPESYRCSSRWGRRNSSRLVPRREVEPGQLLAAINQQTSGEADQQLAAAIAADAGRTVDWLESRGAAFTEASTIGWHRFTLAPSRLPVAGQDWRGRGPDRLLGELRQRLEERQVGEGEPAPRPQCGW